MEDLKEVVKASTRYMVECFDKDGNLKWTDFFQNTVVTEGLNTLLARTFNAVPGDVNWYVFLKGLVGGINATDTMASKGTWTELTPYSGNRPAWTKNGAPSGGAMSNSSSKAVFTINASATVTGAGLTSANTGTAGLLFGLGDFSQSRAVISGDSLNVQVDPSVTAS